MKNIGAAMNGGNGKKDKGDEFFPTPEGTTRALMAVLREIEWPEEVWECSCGEGHISKQLEQEYIVTSSNLTDRGYGNVGIDFLKTERAYCPSIVTNPPFSLADEFIVHALEILGITHLALLLPSGFYHAKGRVKFFEAYTPSLILPLTWRLDVSGQKRPTLNCSWYVWASHLPPVRGFYPLASNEKHPGRYDAANAAQEL